ncbi:MAG: hypothetical protein Q7U91_13250 [Sideroxyarcus sp.]|nr:hypothetical protein [Sideroxyarcus sp.]
MKRAFLNLLALAVLQYGGAAFAYDEAEPMAAPMEEFAESPASPAAPEPQTATASTDTQRDIPTKTNRSKSLDLRYCLELQTNVEIAKCAGE